MNLRLKTLAIVLLGLLPITANATDCSFYGKNWQRFSNLQLGVSFCYPPKLLIKTEGQDIYVLTKPSAQHTKRLLSQNNTDLLFNGKRMLEPSNYVVHIKVARGDFNAANHKESIFVKDKGVVRPNIGRFGNGPAQAISGIGWFGYKAKISCSTTDSQTGFHAAGGECLWIVGSDGRHNFVLDTLGDPTDAILAWKIAKSLCLLQSHR